jgi:hypothetical protein
VLPTDDQRILLTQSKPGMVLSRAVVSPSHITLCSGGTELTLDLIDRLSSRGVKRLWVAGHPVPPPRPEDFLAFETLGIRRVPDAIERYSSATMWKLANVEYFLRSAHA